jgi:hypothetical protein
MHRGLCTVLCLLTVPLSLRADTFDRYTNPVLAKVPGADGVQEIKQLTPSLIAANDRVLTDAPGALVVVKTNEGRYGKLLVQAARQKAGPQTVPILILERFVTYKDGEERAVQAAGRNVFLFEGFHFHLDFGQVVPPALGGDLRLVVEGRKVYAEPVGQARLYLVTQPLGGTEPKKADAPVAGGPFEPRFFNGTYKLHDDGRRSGLLTLQVAANGDVSGHYFSGSASYHSPERTTADAPLTVAVRTLRPPFRPALDVRLQEGLEQAFDGPRDVIGLLVERDAEGLS